jgi:uncharacterized protein (TIGR02266 family)
MRSPAATDTGVTLMEPQLVTVEHAAPCDERASRRVQIARVIVRYQVGRAEFVVGDVLNMSLGGIFVVASRPLAVGKVIALEMRIAGEPRSVPLSGRVAWRRTVAEEGRPKGMGICFVAVAPPAREVIGRLVTIREPTMYGLGAPEEDEIPIRSQAILRPRELDVRETAPEPAAERNAGCGSVFPPREPDTTAVGKAGKMRPREASLVFDLVTKKKKRTMPPGPKR